jgi:hypothetical protein
MNFAQQHFHRISSPETVRKRCGSGAEAVRKRCRSGAEAVRKWCRSGAVSSNPRVPCPGRNIASEGRARIVRIAEGRATYIAGRIADEVGVFYSQNPVVVTDRSALAKMHGRQLVLVRNPALYPGSEVRASLVNDGMVSDGLFRC